MVSPVCYLERSLSLCKYPNLTQLCFFSVLNLSSSSGVPLSYIFVLFLYSAAFSFLSPCSQLLFVVGFTVFLANCVDYDILFANKFVNHTDSSKVTLPDAFLPVDVCSARWLWISIKFF